MSLLNEKATCRLCGRQFAKYNCPTCNVPYCSLTCFRSPSHSQCSETFYKKEVEHEIHSGPSKTPQERLKMMELLKRFEEESTQTQQDSLDSEGEDDDQDLSRRLQGVDLDSASPVDLWSRLTSEEQAEFLKIMDNPTSGTAQRLLASEEFERGILEPWWEAPSVEQDGVGPSRLRRRFGSKPNLIPVPAAMVKSVSNGLPLYYNVCAVCIAYSYTTRRLLTSPLSDVMSDSTNLSEGRRLISELAPFLTDRKSTTLHTSLSSLITDMWSRFKPGELNPELSAVLLRDASHLIRPLPVTKLSDHHAEIPDPDLSSHPHLTSILVFSDLARLFEAPSSDKQNRMAHVTHKLLFYAAHVLAIPSQILRGVAEELIVRSSAYQMEMEGEVVTVRERHKPVVVIEEL